MLRDLDSVTKRKPAVGEIVRDTAGTRYEVLQVGLKLLVVKMLDGTNRTGHVYIRDVFLETPAMGQTPTHTVSEGPTE